MNAVRWLTPPRDIAALVHCDQDKLRAELFHFGEKDRPMGGGILPAQARRLCADPRRHGIRQQPGRYARQEFAVTGPRTRVTFTLPAQKSCLLRVERE